MIKRRFDKNKKHDGLAVAMATTSPATTRSRRCAQRPQRFRTTEVTGDGVVEEIQRIRLESSAHSIHETQTGATVQGREEVNSNGEEVTGIQILLQAARTVEGDQDGQSNYQNGGVVTVADDGTPQEDASGGETVAVTLMDHLYTMRPDQQTMASGNGRGANREVVGNVGDAAVPITNNQVHQDGTATGAGTTSTVGTNTENRLKWGGMTGVEEISVRLHLIHARIVIWKKNIFNVPRGQAGRDFVTEAVRLLKLFNTRSAWESVAIQLLIVFFPLMLQKPSQKSKASDHSRYLTKRLQWWKEGKLVEIMSEAETIQKRLMKLKGKAGKEDKKLRSFANLMMEGKVKRALKLVDSDNGITGVHEMTDDVRNSLQAKHPDARDADTGILINGEVPHVEAVIFEEINAQSIQAAAKSTQGSGGPTKVDADIWKHILCSKVFGKLSDELAEQTALLARRLCTDEIPHEHTSFYYDGRLVALKKQDNGIRPVGVGEALRRIVGKSVGKVTKLDVQLASGLLQTCSGIESGIEAAIHAMARTWENEECEAVLLIDAENAFNSLNRAAALHNVSRRCPQLSKYLQNSYRQPSKMHLGDGSFILSNEGCTQGDTQAMSMYAVSMRGLSDKLRAEVPDVTQVWYADDNSGGGKMNDLKNYWDAIKEIGPPYGYHPKPPKSILIVKDHAMLQRAEELFAGEGVVITSEGERHIGAAIGSENFKTQFVTRKIENWIKDVEELATIAKEEPQCALSAFNKGVIHRWAFIQRTVKNISDLFQPLEDAIRNRLIPAIVGRDVSDLERKLLALPYRYGGLGILNPKDTADREYRASKDITANLTGLIHQQDMDVSHMDREAVAAVKASLKKTKEERLKQEYESVVAELDMKAKRLVEAACEKGASSWLSALPLRRYGYILNKREFQDAICLRYGWTISGTPKYCACKQLNSGTISLLAK